MDYATFLKRKFAPNPQEPNQASLQTRSGTKSYTEAIQGPPMKRVNQLHFSKFSTPNALQMNSIEDTNQDHSNTTPIEKLDAALRRLEELEKKSTLNQAKSIVDWETELDKHILGEKMAVIINELDNQLQEFETKTNDHLQKNEKFRILCTRFVD